MNRTVKVYLWKTRLLNGEPGHCALCVDGSYFSFWPGQSGEVASKGRSRGKKRKKSGLVGIGDCPNTYSDSYEEDVEDCHGEADTIVAIKGLCHGSMCESWATSLRKPYNLQWYNCATVARLALDAGFDGSTFRSAGDALYRGFRWITRPFSGVGNLCCQVVGDTTVWTPALVHERALYIKSLVE